jgi:hypothetical protein
VPGTWFIVGSILIPLGFGLIPGMLPRRLPLADRWALWLALLAVAAGYVASLRSAPHALPGLALALLGLSSLLSFVVLLAETARGKARVAGG